MMQTGFTFYNVNCFFFTQILLFTHLLLTLRQGWIGKLRARVRLGAQKERISN
jgi:hypothetical protein